MKPLSNRAERVFRAAMAQMGEKQSVKIGQDGDTFLPLVVERVGPLFGEITGGLISFAHYIEQNGDLCRDPEVVMLDGLDGRLYPISYRLDLSGIDHEALEYGQDGRTTGRYWKRMQADIWAFCGVWSRNLVEQHPELKN
jgi:hypothetical protein